MADQFNLDLQQQNHLKPSLSDMELLNSMGNSATAALGNFNSNNVNGLMAFPSNDNYPDHNHHHQRHHELLPVPNFNIDANIQSSLHPLDSTPHLHLRGPLYDPITHFLPLPTSNLCPSLEPESMRLHSSPQIFSSGIVGENKTNKNQGYGGKKRKRSNEKLENEKSREVVHVRARRGQATDSHSLAERLRREKINEKLRCLQDLVPGCYKTMGMAVMLDVIITYVRSLQNQIEFLSMKLSAASLFYDFNSSEMEALDAMQGTNGYEPQVMERMVGGEGYGGLPQFQSTWPL